MHNKTKKVCYVVYKNDVFVGQFNSMKEAGQAMGIKKIATWRLVHGLNKNRNGYSVKKTIREMTIAEQKQQKIKHCMHVKAKFCKNLNAVENFRLAEADGFKGWDLHHRLGEKIPREQLIADGLYYNRPPEELVFLRELDHYRLHIVGKTGHHKGMTWFTDGETDLRATECPPGFQPGRSKLKDRLWFNDGLVNKRAKECPPGFSPGQLRKKK